jgi:ribulose kinase
VLGIPIQIGEQQECTVLGAALAGFVGAGIFNDLQEAAESFKDKMVTVDPEPKLLRAYREQYARFKKTFFNN